MRSEHPTTSSLDPVSQNVLCRFGRDVIKNLLLLICLGAVACGSEDDGSVLKADEPDHTLLSVVMAGSDSCHAVDGVRTPRGASIYPEFSALMQKMHVHQAIRSDYIMSCYSLRGQLLVTNSDDPQTVQAMSESDLPGYVQRFYETHASKKLLWIGHSYGGWLSLKTILAMHTQSQHRPHLDLFTLDPISKQTCSVTKPLGCSSAPTDVSDDEYLRLGSFVQQWMNFYQRKTPVVRSSAVKGARHNIELGVGHTKIDNHPTVWRSIESTLAHAAW